MQTKVEMVISKSMVVFVSGQWSVVRFFLVGGLVEVIGGLWLVGHGRLLQTDY